MEPFTCNVCGKPRANFGDPAHEKCREKTGPARPYSGPGQGEEIAEPLPGIVINEDGTTNAMDVMFKNRGNKDE